MSSSVDPIAAHGARFRERFVEVDRGVELRVLCWSPESPARRPPLVFVPGWVSVVEGWADLLCGVVGEREVRYIETREKGSARIARRALTPDDFSIERMAADLVAATAALDVVDDRTTIMASSLGATAVLEAAKDGGVPAARAFLIGPSASFRFPAWGHPFLYFPAPAYWGLKYIVLWYLRTFRVDVEREPEQMQRYERTVRAAHAQRIKLSSRSVRGYSVWPRLRRVGLPVAVAYARSDSLHDESEIERLVQVLPQGRAVLCPSNLYMHSAQVIADLHAFEASDTKPGTASS
jgi:pimeloyl-ACP methyl ester carboxylesterase